METYLIKMELTNFKKIDNIVKVYHPINTESKSYQNNRLKSLLSLGKVICLLVFWIRTLNESKGYLYLLLKMQQPKSPGRPVGPASPGENDCQ